MRARDPKFNFEILKLLLQAAWADLEIAEAEEELIIRQAEALELLPEDREKVNLYLQGSAPLPPPDLGLLKIHREEVLKAVGEVLICDLKILPEEKVIWEEIKSLLTED